MHDKKENATNRAVQLYTKCSVELRLKTVDRTSMPFWLPILKEEQQHQDKGENSVGTLQVGN